MSVEPVADTASPSSLPAMGGGDAAAPLSEPAEIDDLLGLGKAFRLLAAARSRIREIEQTAERERERIGQWEADATANDRKQAAFWEGRIGLYARKRRADSRDHNKSLTTTWGAVRTRQEPPEIIRDEATLGVWAESRGFMTTREVKSVDWKAIKERAVHIPGGLMQLDGEVIPGVVVREREIAVEVDIWE